MAEQSGEKSQDPTPHRRQEARKKGQVPQSQDLSSATLLVGAILILMGMGGKVIHFFIGLIGRQLGGDAWLSADAPFLISQWKGILGELADAMLPVLGLMMLTAVAVHIVQIGFLFLPERIAPDPSRISLIRGIKRLFSLSSVMRLAFGLFKVLVVAVVALASLYWRRDELIGLAALSVPQIAGYVADLVLGTCLKIGVALLILALLDYWYQRWKHEQELRMTHQEVREEMKNLQGDPQVIARRRQVQRQLVLNRLDEVVPKADVVVTNPTELAIAIQYVPEKMAAPIVLAKGAGVMAQRIRRIAVEHNIPIIEKKPLAQALYKQVDINQPIPSEFYAAVAEILAYVYRLKGKEIPPPPQAGFSSPWRG